MGSGAFGTVYGCRDSELDIPVAVKELHVLDADERAARPRAVSRRSPALVAICAILTSCRATTNRSTVSGTSARFAASIFPMRKAFVPTMALQFVEIHVALLSGDGIYRRAGFVATAWKSAAANWTRKRRCFTANKSRRRFGAHPRARSGASRYQAGKHSFAAQRRPNRRSGFALGLSASPRKDRARPATPTARARSVTRRAAAPSATRPTSPAERRNPDARSDIHAWGMTWYHLLSGLDPTDPDELRKSCAYHRLSGFRPELSEWDDLIGDCPSIPSRHSARKTARSCWSDWTN